jgi:2-succinyl-5-enolpyruvyl-6-hydroxy-3-cyclohexene-1-carboxylate synthase
MLTSAKLEVQLLLDGCKRVGITKMVISPGSRNAPISVAFDEDPEIEVVVVVDERSAAFVALGMAHELGAPVAIACTSGSAPLNYFPAVAEAYYQGIPLVVITADRPTEWIDQGDGQTIQQANVYGSHVKAFAQLNPISHNDSRWLFERQLAEVLQIANAQFPGPVHLNIPFSEPLYEVVAQSQRIEKWIEKGKSVVQLSLEDEEQLRNQWTNSAKRLIIVGQQRKNRKLQKLLETIVNDGSVAVLVEHTSNVQHPYFVHCIDRSLNLMDESEVADFQPDLIITIGGAIISKRIKRFLRQSDAPVIRFGQAFPFMDTYQNLTFTSNVLPENGLEFICKLIAEHPMKSRFGFNWKTLDFKGESLLKQQSLTLPFSDFKVIELLLDVLPENSQIHISNSSMIRYALLFDPVRSMRYYCNRGTSGIDGSSSTAVGAALMDPENCHVLITGDLSFFYDSNAWWNASLPFNLRIVVVNNGGGDIFNIIPGPKSTAQHERIFLAQHAFQATKLAQAFDLEGRTAASLQEMNEQWEWFFQFEQNDRPKLLEIHTSGIDNSGILNQFFEGSKNEHKKESPNC